MRISIENQFCSRATLSINFMEGILGYYIAQINRYSNNILIVHYLIREFPIHKFLIDSQLANNRMSFFIYNLMI